MAEPQDFSRPRAARHRPGLCEAHTDETMWSEAIRALYDGVVQEPLPPDFIRLLNELQKKI